MPIHISDEWLSALVPVAVYWIYSGFYELFRPMLWRYRMHTIEEQEKRNSVSRLRVAMGVLGIHAFQIFCFFLAEMLKGDSDHGKATTTASTSTSTSTAFLQTAYQFVVAMVVMDTYFYFMHRAMHVIHFLYKHVHAEHHRLYVPHAFGAIYKHPVEGFSDNLGGLLAMVVSGMSPKASMVFFTLATVRNIDLHCGMYMPWDRLFDVVSISSAFHDTHHQLWGNKYNYSAPFFSFWDKVLGTYKPYDVAERKNGGYELKPVKRL